MRFVVFFILGSLWIVEASFAVATSVSCAEVLNSPKNSTKSRLSFEEQLIDKDLIQLQRKETQGLSPKQVERMNQKTVLYYDSQLALPAFTRDPNSGRFLSVDQTFAYRFMTSMFNHPIINYQGEKKYQHEDRIIGYCFGRATYVHIGLLKLGVHRSAIKKIWIVGDRAADGTIWDYHVATMVFVADQGWMVLDTVYSQPLKLRDWYKTFEGQSLKGDVRIYVSDAKKFSITPGGYTPLQLGLYVPHGASDWYKGYFVDLMAWFRSEESLKYYDDLGLLKR